MGERQQPERPEFPVDQFNGRQWKLLIREGLYGRCIFFWEIILPALVTDLESSREEAGSPFGVLVKIIVIRINLSANFS